MGRVQVAVHVARQAQPARTASPSTKKRIRAPQGFSSPHKKQPEEWAGIRAILIPWNGLSPYSL